MSRFLKDLASNRIVVVIIAITFFISGGATYLLLRHQSSSVTSPISDTVAPSVAPFEIPQELANIDSFNVLLLGYGGAGHDGGYLTDVIILAHFDFTNQVLGLISIPRDLWVKLPDGRESKINAAFVTKDAPQYPTESVSLDEALEGAVKTKSVIEQVTGLTPHFFVGIDFNSFKALIDQLGGITVDVPESFSDSWYPIKGRELELCGLSPEEIVDIHQKYSGFDLEKQFACRYEDISFTKGKTEMDGETALKFVRSRHSSSDFARSKRQWAVLLGIRNTLLSPTFFNDPDGVFETLQKLVQTNMQENLAKNIVPLLAGFGDYTVVAIGLSDENVLQNSKSSQGAFILVPKGNGWESVQEYIATQLQQ